MIYVVTKLLYDDDEWSTSYVESVEKIFANEGNAIEYIRKSVVDERKDFDRVDPLEEAEGYLVRDYEDPILEGVEVRSFRYFDMVLSYMYKSYEVV